MRIVTAEISKLGLKTGDEINLELVDIVGKPFMTQEGYSLSEDIVISSESIEISLLENDKIKSETSYKLTIPNGFTFNFFIKTNLENKNIDLIGQLKVGCYEEIIEIKYDKVVLSEKFIKKLDIYFAGENPHFTQTEESLFNLYSYYADNVHQTPNTIDVVKVLDTYLSTLFPEA